MPNYRVRNSDGRTIDESECADSAEAYDWFSTVTDPGDVLGYRLEVYADGGWEMLETGDGGMDPAPGNGSAE